MTKPSLVGCPIDYRRQQRERWIKIVFGQGYFEPYKEDDRETVEEIVDAIMESEHSVVAEQAAEIERLKAELEEIRALLPRVYDGMHLAECPYVDVLMRIRAALSVGVDETYD